MHPLLSYEQLLEDMGLAVALYNGDEKLESTNSIMQEMLGAHSVASFAATLQALFGNITGEKLDSVLREAPFSRLAFSEKNGICRVTRRTSPAYCLLIIEPLGELGEKFALREIFAEIADNVSEVIAVSCEKQQEIYINTPPGSSPSCQHDRDLSAIEPAAAALAQEPEKVITAHHEAVLGKTFYSSVLRDKSALINLEKEMQKNLGYLHYSQKVWGSLVEYNHNLILVTDGEGIINFSNRGFLESSALPLIGRRLHDLVHAKEQDKMMALSHAIISGQTEHGTMEAELCIPDGRCFQCRWLASRLPRQDGTLGATWIITDIGEEAAMRQRALIAEKQVATGRMAARIAHEINNPLAGISGAMALIKMDFPKEHASFMYVEMVEKEISRLSSIIRQMYGLFTPGSEALSELHLPHLLNECRVMMAPLAEQGGISLCLAEVADVSLRACENRLREVLYNLIRNAIEASPAGARVELSAHIEDDKLFLVVDDEGRGLSSSMDNLFEPFFTTKQTFKGSGLGLGLSISRSLANAMGGDISLSPRSSGGTRAHLQLPLGKDGSALSHSGIRPPR